MSTTTQASLDVCLALTRSIGRAQGLEDAGLRAAAACPPHLVVADIAMPGMDGYAMITRLRTAHPLVPAIAVSAHARLEDRDRAFNAGFDAYHTKPIEAARLLDDARSLLRRRPRHA